MSDLRTIARILGGELAGNQISCPGPGHSPHDRSLSVTFRKDGSFVCYSFAGDPWQLCRDHVRRLLGMPEGSWRRELRPPAMPLNPGQGVIEEPAKSKFALKLWNDAEMLSRRLLERYLLGRGLDISRTSIASGETIRYHDRCPFGLSDGTTVRLPAMLCLFRDIRTNEPRAIHRTALKPDGSGKADLPGLNPKMMLGSVKDAAIKLSSDDSVTTGLAIAEGIETALTGFLGGLAPVWALGSAGAIRTFPVLPGVEALTILADHDDAGLEAARTCARTWARNGRSAVVSYPQGPGRDWNDVVRAAS